MIERDDRSTPGGIVGSRRTSTECGNVLCYKWEDIFYSLGKITVNIKIRDSNSFFSLSPSRIFFFDNRQKRSDAYLVLSSLKLNIQLIDVCKCNHISGNTRDHTHGVRVTVKVTTNPMILREHWTTSLARTNTIFFKSHSTKPPLFLIETSINCSHRNTLGYTIRLVPYDFSPTLWIRIGLYRVTLFIRIISHNKLSFLFTVTASLPPIYSWILSLSQLSTR